jgi:hypothetical protein
MNAAPKYPAAIPTLDELAQDPLRASDLAADALAALAARCAVVQSALAAAQFALVVNAWAAEAPASHDDDRLLGIKEAAAKLAVTRDYLYRRKDLPFRESIAAGQVRFCALQVQRLPCDCDPIIEVDVRGRRYRILKGGGDDQLLSDN